MRLQQQKRNITKNLKIVLYCIVGQRKQSMKVSERWLLLWICNAMTEYIFTHIIRE